MITSLSNPKVKLARALHGRKARYRERQFIIEGVRLVEEALKAGIIPAFVLYSERLQETPRGQTLLDALEAASVDVWEVSEAVLGAVATTMTPQGMVAVVPFVQLAPGPDADLHLVVDGVRDPGNLGTILRTAEAAGVDQVILAPRTVDVYNPKVVRAAMGAHFQVSIFVAHRWEQVSERLGGVPAWLADIHASQPYDAVDWRGPVALIVSGEAYGPSPEARALAREAVSIPMPGPAESLNTAVATGIILFEILRQRRASPGS